jgi:glycosyltransferase involved in cell wall biosynthesis
VGALEPAELARWYRGARAVAVPSWYEGFGFPLLEAMACGTPAIASRATSLTEVGGEGCAWIDDPLDVAAWSAALERVAGDEALRGCLRAAGLEQAATFSWDRCAEETLGVLRRAAEAA